MKCQPSVSVVIPFGGNSDDLRRCLDALERQDYDAGSVEIVVVNNAPAPLKELRQGRWPVRVVNEPRQGPAAARNCGVSASRGNVLAFIDADCVAHPCWLTAGVAELLRQPHAVVAGAIQRCFNGKRGNPIELFDSVTWLQQRHYVTQIDTFVTANALMTREVFTSVGGFNEVFTEAAGEDWEWALRAKQRGVRLVYADDAIVSHGCIRSLRALERKVRRVARGERLLTCLMGQPVEQTVGAQLWAVLARAAGRARRAVSDGRVSASRKPAVIAVIVLAAAMELRSRLKLPPREALGSL